MNGIELRECSYRLICQRIVSISEYLNCFVVNECGVLYHYVIALASDTPPKMQNPRLMIIRNHFASISTPFFKNANIK